MRSVARALLTLSTLVGALTFATLAMPEQVFACSCMVSGPEAIGTFADEPSIVVFIGTVASVDQRGDQFGRIRGELVVQRVFKGPIPAARMPVVGGGGGDCTISLVAGQRMITAASFEGGVITPGLCMPYGDPTTPEGQRLIDEATKAYGAGGVPPGVPETPTDPPAASDGEGGAGDGALSLAGAIGIAVLLFAGLALLTRRSPSVRDA